MYDMMKFAVSDASCIGLPCFALPAAADDAMWSMQCSKIGRWLLIEEHAARDKLWRKG